MLMYQSELRHSEINELIEKVENQNYGQYLRSLKVERARSLIGQKITFDFPITAIIGPNGGGKSTVLGAAALLYIDFKPSHFMAKSGKYDESMQNWAIEYEAIDKREKQKDFVKRTASFTRFKWYRKALKRPGRIFGVSRTVPATERKELRQCVSGSYESNITPIDINNSVVKGVARILDKDISKYKTVSVDARGRVTLLAGETKEGIKYSEFHFGAGESSIIRMLVELDALPENAFVLIEEIENGLHPVACIRLVEHLISLAKEKSLQVIFTTHSNDALKPLPSKAIWASVAGRLFQGKLDVASLRAVTGEVTSKLTIFVEDDFSATWTRILLQNTKGTALDALGIHAMKGDGIAVKIHTHHNIDPSIKHNKSICIIDGDSRQTDCIDDLIFRLPGQSPELFIFDQVMAKIGDVKAELTVALLRPYEEHDKVAEILRSVGNLNRDPHLIYAQIGKRLGFVPADRVIEAFITIWTRTYSETAQEFVAQFTENLPKETDQIQL